jgi:hypothetical protein
LHWSNVSPSQVCEVSFDTILGLFWHYTRSLLTLYWSNASPSQAIQSYICSIFICMYVCMYVYYCYYHYHYIKLKLALTERIPSSRSSRHLPQAIQSRRIPRPTRYILCVCLCLCLCVCVIYIWI